MRDYKGPNYKENFCMFLAEEGAFKTGDFTLKSGRKSPYFINMGGLNSGQALNEMSMAYAARIDAAIRNGEIGDFDVLFGLPYKGITLATGVAMVLDKEFGKTVKFSSHRKEAKDHGDKGIFLGYVPQAGDRCLIIDDVFTTGDTKEEGIEVLSKAAPGSQVVGVSIAADRNEALTADGKSAIHVFEDKYHLPVISIVTIDEIIRALYGKEIKGKVLVDVLAVESIAKYKEQYGARR